MSIIKNIFNSLSGRNKRNRDGETKLFRAARSGNLRMVKKLLKRRADPNIPDKHGMTPLHLAAYWGEAAIVALLLKHGAAVNADNGGKGWTPLHSAALAGGERVRGDVIALLRAGGANDNIQDKHGWTPTDYMMLWEHNAHAAQKLQKILAAQTCPKEPPHKNHTGPKAPRH